MEKATFRKTAQKNPKKEELKQVSLTQDQRDMIILEAALEFGSDALYEIAPGTLGTTLYIDCLCKEDSSRIRKSAPMTFHGLYVVVRYPTNILTHADLALSEDPYADLYDPKLT